MAVDLGGCRCFQIITGFVVDISLHLCFFSRCKGAENSSKCLRLDVTFPVQPVGKVANHYVTEFYSRIIFAVSILISVPSQNREAFGC